MTRFEIFLTDRLLGKRTITNFFYLLKENTADIMQTFCEIVEDKVIGEM